MIYASVKPMLTTLTMVNDTDDDDDSDDILDHDDSHHHNDDDNDDDKNDVDDNDDDDVASTRFSRLSFVRNSFKNISNIFLQTQLPIFFYLRPQKYSILRQKS